MILGSVVGRDCYKKNNAFEFLSEMFWLGCLNAFERFDVFSAIRLKGNVAFLIGKFLGVFYFPRALIIVSISFGKGFLSSFISKYVFQVIVN